MSNNEPRDASHYRPHFANPAGRISELESMLEFAKEEIESFRDKWIAEKQLREHCENNALEARDVIKELVEYAECNDPGNPHLARAKGFLSGGEHD